jgi:hypothetical protein
MKNVGIINIHKMSTLDLMIIIRQAEEELEKRQLYNVQCTIL